MARKYGTFDQFSIDQVLKISEDSYFQDIENQKILDEDIQLAIDISIIEIGEEMMQKENEDSKETGDTMIYDDFYFKSLA